MTIFIKQKLFKTVNESKNEKCSRYKSHFNLSIISLNGYLRVIGNKEIFSRVKKLKLSIRKIYFTTICVPYWTKIFYFFYLLKATLFILYHWDDYIKKLFVLKNIPYYLVWRTPTLRPSAAIQGEMLIGGLSDILFKASEGKESVICMLGYKEAFDTDNCYRADGYTERVFC